MLTPEIGLQKNGHPCSALLMLKRLFFLFFSMGRAVLSVGLSSRLIQCLDWTSGLFLMQLSNQ